MPEPNRIAYVSGMDTIHPIITTGGVNDNVPIPYFRYWGDIGGPLPDIHVYNNLGMLTARLSPGLCAGLTEFGKTLPQYKRRVDSGMQLKSVFGRLRGSNLIERCQNCRAIYALCNDKLWNGVWENDTRQNTFVFVPLTIERHINTKK